MISRILERLEAEREIAYADFDKYANDYELDLEDAYDDFFHKGLARAKEIVQEVAKEYTSTENINCSTDSSTRWIPCSERLPDFCGYSVLLTVENAFGQRDVCKAFTNYMKEGKLLFYTNEKEFCSELTSSKLSDAWKPIAWQPLPAPYQIGEEENE